MRTDIFCWCDQSLVSPISKKKTVQLLRVVLMLLSVFAVLFVGDIRAEIKAAETTPINIEADKATLSEKQGKSVYSGNVILTQGDIRVSADVITVFSRDGKLLRITATGSPVTYQQRSPKNDINAEARQLDYFANEERVVLLDTAKLSQGRNTFSGNRIEYHTRTEVVTAAVSAQGTQRVQVTIHPEKQNIPPVSPQSNNKPVD
ncbi:MAG: lipopolysaccharide transport periplasmic protein LptA [Gammaproteobacteria bacterium]|nr:lipopolysaccharide transport periplasmic protein LptA [Gammaproteobacteria bacterium]